MSSIKKIQVTSKIVAVLTKILYIVMIVIVCFEVTGIIWLAVSPEASSITLGSMQINSPFALANNMGIETVLLTGVASQCFLIAVLILANRIFRDIHREYSPFTQKTVKGMRRIAVLLFIDGIAAPQIDHAIRKAISATADIFYESGNELMILAIVFFCFSLIFQYGLELQKQSDETL